MVQKHLDRGSKRQLFESEVQTEREYLEQNSESEHSTGGMWWYVVML